MSVFRHGDMLIEGDVAFLRTPELKNGALLEGDISLQDGARILVDEDAKLVSWGEVTLYGGATVGLPDNAPAVPMQPQMSLIVWLDVARNELVFQTRGASAPREGRVKLGAVLGAAAADEFTVNSTVAGKTFAQNDKVAMPVGFGAYSRGQLG